MEATYLIEEMGKRAKAWGKFCSCYSVQGFVNTSQTLAGAASSVLKNNVNKGIYTWPNKSGVQLCVLLDLHI